MTRIVVIGLAALLLVAGAAAKAPPSGMQLCGTNECTTIDAQAAEQLFQIYGFWTAPPGPTPFYVLRWSWGEGETLPARGYWVPLSNAVRLDGSGWSTLEAEEAEALKAAAADLEPITPRAPTAVTVGGRPVSDPASYTRLLAEGTRVSRWYGALGWIPVKLVSAGPTPWTDGTYDLRISKGAGFVWREGAVYRIPLALARRARLGLSLGP